MFDANLYAAKVLGRVTRDMMQGVTFDLTNETDKGKLIYDMLCDECSTHLVDDLLNFFITVEQYNETRDALGQMLFKVCFSDDPN